jgi:hypothetical protein
VTVFIPREINPPVFELMKEIDCDLSDQRPVSLFELFKERRLYNYAIPVCEKETDIKCPSFRG